MGNGGVGMSNKVMTDAFTSCAKGIEGLDLEIEVSEQNIVTGFLLLGAPPRVTFRIMVMFIPDTLSVSSKFLPLTGNTPKTVRYLWQDSDFSTVTFSTTRRSPHPHTLISNWPQATKTTTGRDRYTT